MQPRVCFAGIVLFLLPANSLPAQTHLTPQENRGREIFERGASPSGSPITAAAGGGPISASIPCSNCHGHNGEGKPEGGIFPSNVTWDALTKPYGLTHPDGRTHPPYTERLLKRAITAGTDPAGNTLNKAMPRFQLSLADSSDLIAYMMKLGQAADPGLTATSVRLGVILPPSLETGQIIRHTLTKHFKQVND